MEATTDYLTNLMGEVSSIHKDAEKMGPKVTLHGVCGLACWVQWMCGRIFCKHNRQMCKDCGLTWLRFCEPKSHKIEHENGKQCAEKIPEKTREVIRIFRDTAARLVFTDTPISLLLDGYMTKPCSRLCQLTFHSDNGCCHGFKFCKKCNELWDISTHPKCPRSRHSGNERCPPTMEAMDVLGSTLPYDSSDTECDDLCFHMFKVLDSDVCRHQMNYCAKCYNVWDGCAQCTCSLYGNSDSEDEIVYVKGKKYIKLE